MGKPMVMNLAKGLPPGSKIHLHDVVTAAVDELCTNIPEIMVKCDSAKEVAGKSVSQTA